ncbi:n-acetylglutamate synthase [Nannochloropsis gaditana]|uniref:N-acetylglutamate synthase n=1 Tax=Nannochloropsis gaditana TaxID=72520 RepID=W7TKB7_9STRA|nr:n-acetylglutamate synthase [Nannochloropsis gaditana]
MQWFLERGFEERSVGALPESRRDIYNWERKSKIYMKDIKTVRDLDAEELFYNVGERRDGAFEGRPGAREKGRSKRSVDDCDLRNDHQWFLSPASGGSRGKRLLPFGAWATQTHAVSGVPALWAQPPLSRIRSLARPSCPTATSSLHRRGDLDQSSRDSPSLQALTLRVVLDSPQPQGRKRGASFASASSMLDAARGPWGG